MSWLCRPVFCGVAAICLAAASFNLAACSISSASHESSGMPSGISSERIDLNAPVLRAAVNESGQAKDTASVVRSRSGRALDGLVVELEEISLGVAVGPGGALTYDSMVARGVVRNIASEHIVTTDAAIRACLARIRLFSVQDPSDEIPLELSGLLLNYGEPKEVSFPPGVSVQISEIVARVPSDGPRAGRFRPPGVRVRYILDSVVFDSKNSVVVKAPPVGIVNLIEK